MLNQPNYGGSTTESMTTNFLSDTALNQKYSPIQTDRQLEKNYVCMPLCWLITGEI
uniref:Uncharacterized protein n=1 Tax=Picea glauca TaxID=3330 RepID=A0A117NGF5_PICGL|nr:hypothetical protein ABT39_MTgene1410 [Picea glauca]QHR92395.1 hypothetical protein Q903MT_gene6438 [Picea sitchensis]